MSLANVHRSAAVAESGAVPRLRLSYRPMRQDDLDAVMEIENVIYAFPWTRGNFEDSLAAGYDACVCFESDVLVGYAVTMAVLDETHVLNVSIRGERQRAGLGSELLGHMIDAARQGGAARMLLEVRPSNTAAAALYRRFGFAEIGRRRGYYPAHGGREDAVVMERRL